MVKSLLAWTIGALLLLASLRAHADAGTLRAEANYVAEWSFTSQKIYPDPFHQVTLDALFTTPDGQILRVPAFWDGGQTWRVRYASPQLGTHRFRTECSDPTNPDLHGVTGALTVVAYRGDNPLYRHGPIRVAPDHRHFQHADGTPFLWLGDTWWMGLCQRLRFPNDFAALTADRQAKGFSVIQIVAGLYPEMAPLDPQGANEAGLPWEKDFTSIRPEYFDRADRRLQYLIDDGLAPCLVGAWGYFLPVMGQERMQQHWRYLIARYGAYPVVWCVAGEANLPYYKLPGFPYEDAAQVRGWTEICRYVHRIDPFQRPLTVHPTGLGHLSARWAVTDPTVLDYDMLQTGHGGLGDLIPTLRTASTSYAASPTLPVVEGEVNYEAIFGPGSNDAALQRLCCWSCLLSGVAGYTYGGNGIWQVNLPDQPPITFGHYPTPTWREAMDLPGSRQVGLACRLLQRYPWQRFTPHPEWAAFDPETPLPLDQSQWLWFPEGNPAQDAPAEKRLFRRTFPLPGGKTVASARLKLSADDTFTAYLNGQEVGSHADWRTGREFSDLEGLLKSGKNVLAVMAENVRAPVPQNPAGLIGVLEVRFTDGTALTLVTDGAWRTAKQAADGWREIDFDERGWVAALPVAAYGQGPWGAVGREDHAPVPYGAGIPGEVRIVYLPQARPVTLLHLEPGRRYPAAWFDPITGRSRSCGTARAGAEGTWRSPTPPRADQDWVLILDRH